MKIELKEIRIRDLVANYTDDNEGGIRGYCRSSWIFALLIKESSSIRTNNVKLLLTQ